MAAYQLIISVKKEKNSFIGPNIDKIILNFDGNHLLTQKARETLVEIGEYQIPNEFLLDFENRGDSIEPAKIDEKGDTYFGEWKNGTKHGVGKIYYKEERELYGRYYFGLWKDGVRVGVGR